MFNIDDGLEGPERRPMKNIDTSPLRGMETGKVNDSGSVEEDKEEESSSHLPKSPKPQNGSNEENSDNSGDDKGGDGDEDDEGRDKGGEKDEGSGDGNEEDSEAGGNEGEEGTEETEPDDSVIGALRQEVYDVDGDFKDDTEGLYNYVKAAVDKARQEGANSALETKPIVKQFNDHIEAGNSPESFGMRMQAFDYSKVDTENSNPDDMKSWIRRDFKEIGLSDRQIENLIEAAEDKGTLKDDFKSSITNLKTRQDTKIQEVLKTEQDQVKNIQQEQKEFDEKFMSFVKGGNIMGVKINTDTQKTLLKYVAEKGEDGRTALDKRLDAITPEEEALINLLLMKDFKISGLVSSASKGKKGDISKFKKGDSEGSKRKSPPSSTRSGGRGTSQSRLPDNLLGR